MNDLILTQPIPADRNPAAVYIASLEASTGRRTQAQALRIVAGILTNGNAADPMLIDWASLRYQHTAAIRVRLAEVYRPATANKILSALRGTLREAWRLGLMSADDLHRAIDLKRIKGETLPAGRELSRGEIKALMHACSQDPTPAGTRDAAIIALMYSTGLRRDEVVELSIDDYDPETGDLVIHGKRNKDRSAYLENGQYEAMRDWLAIRGTEEGPLFLAINKGGKIHGGKLTSQAIYNMLFKRAQEAEVKSFSPHDLRRTWITHQIANGADLVTLSKLAGHSDVKTTARYDRSPEDAKRKVAGLIHVPYKSRE